MYRGVLVVGSAKTNNRGDRLVEKIVLQYGSQGLWYGTFSHFAKLGIKHGISTRLGGVGDHPFSSLNLGLHTGDSEEIVVHNRQLFCRAVGVEPRNVVTAQQVHDDKIQVVTTEHIGRGATSYEDALEGTDALITNIPDIPLLLFFADCVPVLVVDPVKKAIGVIHAGWKGTVNKIAQKTILAMEKQFGTRPADCLVGIAPSVGPCCYEVDKAVVNQVKAQFKQWEQLVHPVGDKWKLDLWLANRLQLEEIGVVSSNIIVSNVCTACNHELFFSYRKESGCTGRIGAVMVL